MMIVFVLLVACCKAALLNDNDSYDDYSSAHCQEVVINSLKDVKSYEDPCVNNAILKHMRVKVTNSFNIINTLKNDRTYDVTYRSYKGHVYNTHTKIFESAIRNTPTEYLYDEWGNYGISIKGQCLRSGITYGYYGDKHLTCFVKSDKAYEYQGYLANKLGIDRRWIDVEGDTRNVPKLTLNYMYNPKDDLDKVEQNMRVIDSILLDASMGYINDVDTITALYPIINMVDDVKDSMDSIKSAHSKILEDNENLFIMSMISFGLMLIPMIGGPMMASTVAMVSLAGRAIIVGSTVASISIGVYDIATNDTPGGKFMAAISMLLDVSTLGSIKLKSIRVNKLANTINILDAATISKFGRHAESSISKIKSLRRQHCNI